MAECKCATIVGMSVTDTTSPGTSKKRRLGSNETEQSSSNYAVVEHYLESCILNSPEKLRFPSISNQFVGELVSSKSGSDLIPACSCSSNDSSDHIVKDCLISVDVEAKGFKTESSTSINNKCSRDTTQVSEICVDSDEMDSSAKKPVAASHRRSSPATKMPSAAEIDEFFSSAEKYEQKRFAEKYNYDVVKDLPLEGRYEWIRLKP